MPIQGGQNNGRTPESSFMMGQGDESPRSYYLEPGSPMISYQGKNQQQNNDPYYNQQQYQNNQMGSYNGQYQQ